MLGALQTIRLRPLGLPGSSKTTKSAGCSSWLGESTVQQSRKAGAAPYLKQEKVITPPTPELELVNGYRPGSEISQGQ